MASESGPPCPSRCCERQFFDSNRIACCYFCSTGASANETGDRSVSGQGILIQLDDSSRSFIERHEQQLAILTSHQLVPTLSSARNWVIGFGGSKKEFPLNDCVDQDQLRVVTCCGPDGSCLWDKQKDHPVSSCPMRGGCSVILLGKDLTREVLAEIDRSLVMFTGACIMPVEAAKNVLLGGALVTVYHRNRSTVLSSPFQISKPPADDSTLLSSNLDWYRKCYSMFNYSPSGPLPFPGAPIIYCEPNTGKPWLLGMHVYLESQEEQYAVSVSHILELIQCNLSLSLSGAPNSHVPKLSLLNQAVQNNICAPRYYENISLFFDNFGCGSLELTDLLQISHYLASEHLLFAQSESFYDGSGIRRASLLLLQALSKLFKKLDLTPGEITTTVDTVKEWCHSLAAEDLQKGFSDLCQQLAFSILPDQNNQEIVEMWFRCWSNLLSLNGLITDPIMRHQLFPTFQGCQGLHPSNVCVQKCFGQMMTVCLTTQFHKLSVFETQQATRDEERREMRQTILELKEKARLYDVEREAHQQQEPPSVGQSTEIEKERQILLLQSQLEASEKDKRELQACLQRYMYQTGGLGILEGYKKQAFDLDIDKDPSGYVGNGHQNNLSRHSETDGPRWTGHQPNNSFDQSRHAQRTYSMPDTSTPIRPTHLQRRANSDAQPYSSNSSISSGYPSPGPSLESSLDSSNASRRVYQHQQSTVSTTSTDSSQYATPIATTPEYYLPRYVGIESKDSFRQQTTREKTEIEAVYKRIVRDHFNVFTKQTQIKSISSLLVQQQLISNDECQSLKNETHSSLTFYTEILPRKGAGAYTLLRFCIREETDHRGHIDLNELFIEEERKVGIVRQNS